MGVFVLLSFFSTTTRTRTVLKKKFKKTILIFMNSRRVYLPRNNFVIRRDVTF